MATDDTITRYGSTGAVQGFAIVVRPDGPWARYEDHERALSAALRERDEARAFIGKLLDKGAWYYSAIELDHDMDGEVLENEALAIAKRSNIK